MWLVLALAIVVPLVFIAAIVKAIFWVLSMIWLAIVWVVVLTMEWRDKRCGY